MGESINSALNVNTSLTKKSLLFDNKDNATTVWVFDMTPVMVIDTRSYAPLPTKNALYAQSWTKSNMVILYFGTITGMSSGAAFPIHQFSI